MKQSDANMTYEHILDAANFIRERLGLKTGERAATLGIVLGSGLGAFADALFRENKLAVFYHEIPHFPTSSVEGHSSRLVLGHVEGKPVLVMQGRVHRYEGYSSSEVAFPIRVLGALGIKRLIVTNAAGAIGDHLDAGDLMLISDHINLTGDNPLLGANDLRLGPRFFDMSECYSKGLRQIAMQTAGKLAITLKEGVYAGVLGPCYETPAEIRYMKTIGADAVGMSTVFEAIAARHGGIECLGISCLTNKASGLAQHILTHDEVTQVAAQASDRFSRLLFQLIPKLVT